MRQFIWVDSVVIEDEHEYNGKKYATLVARLAHEYPAPVVFTLSDAGLIEKAKGLSKHDKVCVEYSIHCQQAGNSNKWYTTLYAKNIHDE